MQVSADPELAPVVASIRGGDPDVGALERLGAPEPGRTAAALREAVLHPHLSPFADSWLPPLLCSARPGTGAEALVAMGQGGGLAPGSLAALARVLGSSPFLARLLQRHPEWVGDLDGDPPGPPAAAAIGGDWTALRAAKYRGLLRIAARDLAGRRFEDSLRELSDLADACLGAALRVVAQERGVEPPALFALGKLGGRELNFSSDVDVLFLYPTNPQTDELARKREVEDFVRSFKSGLEERTADGFGYRVDLDLRPEGRVGTLANSIEAALTYYESFGADWERQMLLRLRAVPGSGAGAESFVREIEPFVYRRLLGVDAIGGVRDMKARIESARRQSGVDLEVDLKEGPGGIRDVEFLVQALQLLLGGREPSLRTGNVVDALAGLASVHVLEPAVAVSLRDAYLWLRRAEHAVQLEEERQTHRFPRDAAAQLELARRMGYGDADGANARDRLLDDWTNVRAEVRRHFDELVLRDADGRGPVSVGFERDLSALVAGTPLAERIVDAAAPLRERRAAELAQLRFPEPLARGLARVVASSPDTARYLSLRPELLARIAGADGDSLRQRRAQLASVAPSDWQGDLEGFIDQLRLFRRDETALAACLDLGGLVAFEEVSSYLSSVADILTDRALAAARDALPGGPGLQFSVLSLGKLAGRELTYHSDLDVLFLYGGDTEEITLASRLAQKLIHYLSTTTGAGTAYAIDSRLRPSGRQGALVTSYDAYATYQLDQARVWEHLALMRCRAVAGDVAQGGAVLTKVQSDVKARREAPWREIAEMRERIRSERADETEGRRAIKTGAGGIMDVDFLATGGQLERGADVDPPLFPAVPALLAATASGRQVDALIEDYRLLRRVEARARWVAGRAVETLDADADTSAVVAELVEPGLDPRDLLARTDAARERIRQGVELVLAANSIIALAG